MSQKIPESDAENLVIAIENTHALDCGSPPALIRPRGDRTYVGFFENPQGDQFIVQIDRQAKHGVVRRGNPDWSTAIAIRDNRLQGDAVWGIEEFAWLTACWAAATGEALEYPDNFA